MLSKIWTVQLPILALSYFLAIPQTLAVDIKALKEDRTHKQFFVFEESTENDLSIEIPTTLADIKAVGQAEEANALAVKLGLIRKAKHTIDMAYYIFKRDIVGYSVLYEVCEAVKRGVDVRILLDSVGSIHPTHGELKALKDCSKKSGFMIDENGALTDEKARIQSVIFNPIIHVPGKTRGLVRRLWNYTVGLIFPQYKVEAHQGWINRRMHDKLLLIDGRFPGKAVAIMGGRNISIDYYGVDKNGSATEDSYKDMEVLIKDLPVTELSEDQQFGVILSNHFDKLFMHLGNKKLRTIVGFSNNRYLKKMRKSITKLLKNQEIAERLNNIQNYLTDGFSTTRAKWVHELQNLTARRTSGFWRKHENKNPNSIEANLRKAFGSAQKKLMIVSPYLFFRKTNGNADPEHQVNEYANLQKWLAEDPERTIEIITNSVLTSDNFMAQSVFDQEVAPQLQTRQDQPEDDNKTGQIISEFENFGQEIISQVEFDQILKDGRIKIYEMGKLDAVEFGGQEIYGKLHAKMMTIDDETSFISTFNGDFRSRDFNSETGLFIYDAGISQILNQEADYFRGRSLLWGSDEWKDMKRKVSQMGGIKGFSTKHQRKIYEIIINLPFLYWAL